MRRLTGNVALPICGLIAACIVTPAGHSAYAAGKKCQLTQLLELPITMNSLRPVIPVKINDRDAKFILDSGAFYSMMSSATAAEYNLKLRPAPFGFRVMGVGGSAGASIATVKEFTIAGVTFKSVEFLAGGSDVAYAGVLGQNFLEKVEVEYDLANGAIRLFRTEDCEHSLLAYWLKPDQSYSSMHINAIDPMNPHTIGVASINGQSLRVIFDTGAFTSLLSAKAAARAGIKPDSAGVVEAGYSGGIGRARVKNYIARFDSFKIGDGEEIKNARLRFADVDLAGSDMLLGADFFISHRVFVANREHKLFLSYNGGPVFNLSKSAGPASGGDATEQPQAADAAVPPATEAAPSTEAVPSTREAAEIARRGAAFAARRDFAPALADLSKAIELDPDDPEYYFQRANAYWASGQADPALQDFDHVIQLKKDFLQAYLPRAQIHLQKKDKPAVMADLETLDALAPSQADLRFSLAQFYEHEEQFSAAILQYDLWIKNHPDDSKMVSALGGRCLASALQNQDLAGGLSDCNKAIRIADQKNPNSARLYSDRGLLLLRQGDYRKALADFDAHLKIEPKSARALYGRGVAKMRMSQGAGGSEDIAAAEALAPRIGERYRGYGIAP